MILTMLGTAVRQLQKVHLEVCCGNMVQHLHSEASHLRDGQSNEPDCGKGQKGSDYTAAQHKAIGQVTRY